MATYNIHLNMIKVQEWKISLSQATLFDLYSKSTSWATEIIHEGLTYYWCARTKVIEEIPVLTDKPDTVYRLTKELAAAGLIMYERINGKDCIRLTEKGKSWNSEKNPSKAQNSENYPNDLGKKSENHSEKNPTYNNTSKDNSTSNKKEREGGKIFTPLAYERLWDYPVPVEYEKVWNDHPQLAEKWEAFCKSRFQSHNVKYASDVQEAIAIKLFLKKCKTLHKALASLDICISKGYKHPDYYTSEATGQKAKEPKLNQHGFDVSRYAP